MFQTFIKCDNVDRSKVAHFLNRTLYLIGMWFGEYQRESIITTHEFYGRSGGLHRLCLKI